MTDVWCKYRFLVSRRVIQISLLVLFVGANYAGWKLLTGNFSSAMVFGKFYLADPYAVLQTLSSGFLVSLNLVIGTVIVAGFYAVIGGRAFCSWVCPMNLVTDFAAWLRGVFGFDNNKNQLSISRKIRYIVLALGLVLSLLIGTAAFEIINPISLLYRGIIFGFGFGWAVVMLVFIFDLFIIENGWCGHVCPVGAFYSLAGRYSLIKVDHKPEKCTKCMKCIVICPESQVLAIIGKKSGQITSGECTNCGRCIEVCDDDSLKYSINRYKS